VRRLRHHLVLGAISALLIVVIAQSFTASLLVCVSAATAYAALLMLAATLLMGPLNVLLRRANPVSNDLRRDAGVWAAGLGIIHTALSLWPGIRGGFGRVFAVVPARLRLDSIGFANDAGLVATCLLIVLVLLSNDRSLRRLGVTRWKAAQRLTYPLFGLVLLHTFLYQRFVEPGAVYVVLLALVLVLVPGLQVQAWLERRTSPSSRRQRS